MNWNVSKEDLVKIGEIVEKAKTMKLVTDTLSLNMDLTTTHLNGCPLDLDKLLSFDDFDFVHDISGIQYHINRTTGELGNCFLPRCAR